MEKTLFIIKPDGVKGELIGQIIERIQYEMHVTRLQMLHLTRHLAEAIYAEHQGKDFFEKQIAFMVSGPVVLIEAEYFDGVVVGRKLVDEIRKEFASLAHKHLNVLHGSDSPESAKRELALFFGEKGVCGCRIPQ